jgi:hypothetical protein
MLEAFEGSIYSDDGRISRIALPPFRKERERMGHPAYPGLTSWAKL